MKTLILVLLYSSLSFSMIQLSNQEPEMVFMFDDVEKQIILLRGVEVLDSKSFEDKKEYDKAVSIAQVSNDMIRFAKEMNLNVNIDTARIHYPAVDNSIFREYSLIQKSFGVLAGDNSTFELLESNYDINMYISENAHREVSRIHNIMDSALFNRNSDVATCKLYGYSKEKLTACISKANDKYNQILDSSMKELSHMGWKQDRAYDRLAKSHELIENRRKLIELHGVKELTNQILKIARKEALEKGRNLVVSYVDKLNGEAELIAERNSIPTKLEEEYRAIIEFTGNNAGAVGL